MACSVTRRINVLPSCFAPEIVMEINVPVGQDAEEYIDELLDSLLREEFRWNCDWDFVD